MVMFQVNRANVIMVGRKYNYFSRDQKSRKKYDNFLGTKTYFSLNKLKTLAFSTFNELLWIKNYHILAGNEGPRCCQG